MYGYMDIDIPQAYIYMYMTTITGLRRHIILIASTTLSLHPKKLFQRILVDSVAEKTCSSMN